LTEPIIIFININIHVFKRYLRQSGCFPSVTSSFRPLDSIDFTQTTLYWCEFHHYVLYHLQAAILTLSSAWANSFLSNAWFKIAAHSYAYELSRW